jgi:hypothetical protein
MKRNARGLNESTDKTEGVALQHGSQEDAAPELLTDVYPDMKGVPVHKVNNLIFLVSSINLFFVLVCGHKFVMAAKYQCRSCHNTQAHFTMHFAF